MSKKSWCNFKSLTHDTQIWGSNKKKFKITLESVLNKCGCFLNRLNLVNCKASKFKLNKQFVNTVAKKCPKLQTIDVDYHVISKTSIELIKPFIGKVEKLNCFIRNDVHDKDLEGLLSQCQKLEVLRIDSADCVLNNAVLDALPHEKLREFTLRSMGGYFPLHTINRVSIITVL